MAPASGARGKGDSSAALFGVASSQRRVNDSQVAIARITLSKR